MLVSTVDVLLAAVSPRTVRFFWAFVVVWAIGGMLLWPFRRLTGGEQGTGEKSTGSEKAIVGVTWFLVSLAVGLAMAAGAPSAAIG